MDCCCIWDRLLVLILLVDNHQVILFINSWHSFSVENVSMLRHGGEHGVPHPCCTCLSTCRHCHCEHTVFTCWCVHAYVWVESPLLLALLCYYCESVTLLQALRGKGGTLAWVVSVVLCWVDCDGQRLHKGWNVIHYLCPNFTHVLKLSVRWSEMILLFAFAGAVWRVLSLQSAPSTCPIRAFSSSGLISWWTRTSKCGSLRSTELQPVHSQ